MPLCARCVLWLNNAFTGLPEKPPGIQPMDEETPGYTTTALVNELQTSSTVIAYESP